MSTLEIMGWLNVFLEDSLKPEVTSPMYSMRKPFVNIDVIIFTVLNAFLVYV